MGVVVYDPAAMSNARSALMGRVRFANSLDECARQADVLAITTPWREFQALSPDAMRTVNGRLKTVIDCWRILQRENFEPLVDYVTLGLGRTGEAIADEQPVPPLKAQMQARGD